MARVWVVGSLNVDRAWRVDRHPSVGETILGDVLAPAAGGKGLNQAVAAARMGAEVALVGCVGADEGGRWLVARASDEGIDVSKVATHGSAATGAALIVIAADGSNTVTVDAGANAELVIPAGQRLGIAADDVVVAQLEVPVGAVAAAFAEAAAVGATSILNPSPLGVGRSLVGVASVVVLNQVEAAELAGEPEAASPDAALRQAKAVARPTQAIVVTLGGSGVVAVDGTGVAVRVEGGAVDAVDTTGAGDCFAGVLAASLADDVPFADALARANAAAALAVTRAGTVDAMPHATDLP